MPIRQCLRTVTVGKIIFRRKVIEAKLSGNHEIEIWGDGHQTRSFMWIDDCVRGTKMIMDSNFVEPLNLGSSELVSINQLVDIVEEIGGVKLKRNYNLTAPKGVNGRNSDNTLIQQIFNWEPATKLRNGLEPTYRWIYDEMTKGSSKANARNCTSISS
jgi:GDP-D-mannose 3',5'-epimerase